ncbi:MAG: PAS domain S-box protein [Bacteroidota bacterium]
MTDNKANYYFLQGGAEMGKLIREKDWSQTSLGDPSDWPQSLQTMVAVMLDNPFAMYIAWGDDYTQLYNDAYRPILGATKHPQALGISTRETFAEIWDVIGDMFDGVMQGKAVGFPDFLLHLNRNGFVEECYFDFSYSPIRKDNGEVGGVLVTVIETTNKKKIEEALKESEARFRAIGDDAPVFIFLAGENAAVEYLNKTWRDYTGISDDDSKGRAWAEITHPDDIDPATKIYMDGFNKRESCTFENRQKGTDGIFRTILWKATPRFSPSGQFIGMMGVGLDIHERKNAEETLRESEERYRELSHSLEEKVNDRTGELLSKNRELEKANKELESFAYISSHDLQEPLRKIQTFANFILDRDFQNLSDGGKDKFQRMQTAAQRMQTLIDDLLAFSRTRTQDGKFKKVNLGIIIEELKEELKEELMQKNAVVEVGATCDVNIILFQFKQLLINLISNSLKFSHGVQHPIIQINCQRALGADLDNEKLQKETTYCHIRISDNGIGFDQRYSEKIFEIFQRLHGKERFQGTGIGLAIVKKIVENHQGIITAKGRLNHGAIFDIYIPAN